MLSSQKSGESELPALNYCLKLRQPAQRREFWKSSTSFATVRRVSMSAGTEHRKLAAIMFTDMVGYSGLWERDEALALELLDEHRRVVRELLARNGGREVKTIGDGFLIEFPSALAAVRAAVQTQQALHERNLDGAPERQVRIRIGVHVGDIVARDGDIHGDGVNIAARIESHAPAGGILVTRAVWEQVHNKIEQELVGRGTVKLKNIERPVEVFSLALPWQSGLVDGLDLEPSGALAGLPRPRNLQTETEPNHCPIRAVAVKPLDDFSGDAGQAYLSDGMTQALCAALGNITALRVPGRSSVMRYKGAAKSIPQMARELNVDAIVEGSVQRAGTRILISAQLIEARSDRHLWAMSYERDLGDFFKVQSEVALAIASEVRVRVTPEEQARLTRTRSADPEAVEACLLGLHHWWQWSDEGFINARQYFQKAIAIAPNYALGHAGEALNYAFGSTWLWRPRDVMPLAKAAAQRAIGLDPGLAEAYVASACVRFKYDWDWTGAENDFKRALELSPNSSLTLDQYNNFLVALRRFDEACAVLEKGLENDPLSPGLHNDLAVTHYYAGRLDQAQVHLRKALELNPAFLQAHIFLGWAYHFTGHPEGALSEFEFVSKRVPDMALPHGALGYAYGALGRDQDAVKQLAELERIARTRYVSDALSAWVWLGLGKPEKALDLLEKCCEERDVQMSYLKASPVLSVLHNEPRFRFLVKRAGLE